MKFLSFAFVPLLVLGCGNGNKTSSPDMAMATTLGPAPTLAVACADKVTDVYTLPAGLPAMDMTHRGDVFHCAVAESLTAAKVNSQLTAYNSTAANATSGFWTYRVAYRTLRKTPTGGGAPAEGDTAAILIIPEKPLAGGPLVVWSHGSLGVAAKCAPSLRDLSATAQDEDFPVILEKLAGYGYTVIAPDYSGFSYGQPPGYFDAEDEAHGVLDATRAAANLLTTIPDKVVIVGHSQGGHAALAAQAYSGSYGLHGTLAGVAVFAPLWTSMAIWAAGTTDAAGLMTANSTSAILYTMEYAYSASALRGDPAAGLDVFQTAKRAAVKDALFGGECADATKLQALGAKPSDFYDTDYVNNVGYSCAANPLGSDCTMAPSTPAGDAPLWLSRWKEDRPALDAKSAPVLIWYGGLDVTVKPGWAECAREKINKDVSVTGGTTMVKVCYDAAATHSGIIRTSDADQVNQWIAARAGIGAEPAACADFPAGMTCLTPPNDL
ncbi:MAG TPA: alpha/beta fold hydrolase [Polyangia bacterium]|jgi:pimeloyl-ACP methyl ester carboxylesterase|nr:alpha/beta fold hydrolase [Polyangia bacterium]